MREFTVLTQGYPTVKGDAQYVAVVIMWRGVSDVVFDPVMQGIESADGSRLADKKNDGNAFGGKLATRPRGMHQHLVFGG